MFFLLYRQYMDDSFERELTNSLTYVTPKDNFSDVESIFKGFTFTQNNVTPVCFFNKYLFLILLYYFFK